MEDAALSCEEEEEEAWILFEEDDVEDFCRSGLLEAGNVGVLLLLL